MIKISGILVVNFIMIDDVVKLFVLSYSFEIGAHLKKEILFLLYVEFINALSEIFR
jgi:hypothetical protein